MRKGYYILDKIQGPMVIVSRTENVFYDEIVDVLVDGNERKKGKVVRIDGDTVEIQMFETTLGMSVDNSLVTFTGSPLKLSLSKEILGREFNGIGEPADGNGGIYSEKSYNINGRPMNPVARRYPRNFIETGISAIDCLATLIRGQKLPIFSGSGLPHNELAAQIIRQAKISDEESSSFAVVFAGMGIKHDDADFFRKSFREAGVTDKVVSFINLADDPIVERIVTPRCALTAAEYLAFEEGMNILVIMTDMTSYCEALRELASLKEEIPSRKGYPGYLYSELASLFERAGMIEGSSGSITQIPILSMPNDDITHPIPDLTGYITEGQIVLSRILYQRNMYPPISILPSLSRLMKDGIGEEYTRADHAEVANQIFSSYSRVQDIKALAQVIGEDEVSEMDRLYLEFGRKLEESFLKQSFSEKRTMIETLDLAWEVLSLLPENELDRISVDTVKARYVRKG